MLLNKPHDLGLSLCATSPDPGGLASAGWRPARTSQEVTAITAPDGNPGGAALPLPQEEETAATSCSQDRCKQERFGTEEMSPCVRQISHLASSRMFR